MKRILVFISIVLITVILLIGMGVKQNKNYHGYFIMGEINEYIL